MLKKALSLFLAFSMVLVLSVSALAADNVTIKQLVGSGEYKTAYVIPNASNKTTYAVSATDLADANNPLYAPQVDSITGYTIPSGTKIDVSGRVYVFWAMEEKNGKLILNRSGVDYSKLVVNNDGKTVQFNAAGYYLFIAQHESARQDPSTAVILKVVGSSSATTKTDTATAKKPTDTTKTDKNASSTRADNNTVEIAGQDRTLGQIQNISGGYLYTVNHGDTLYDLAKRFYGNGNLWKELQKVNQEWLNETKDGIIFVGFNLLIPSELGGVRANV